MGRFFQIYGFVSCACVLYYCWNQAKGDRFRKAIPLSFLASYLFIAIHFKSISMPAVTYLTIGLLGIPAIFYGLLFRYEVLLIVAALYVPHNAILPATFGGLFKAFNGTNIVIGALILGMFFGKGGEGKGYSSKSPANVLVWIFCGTVLLSFLRGYLFWGGGYFGSMLQNVWRFLSPMVLYFIFVRRLPDRGAIRVVSGVLMIVAIMAIYLGVLEWVELGFATYSDFKRRLGGLNKHPNVFGAFIAYYLGLFWGQILVNWRRFDAKLLVFPLLLGMRVMLPTNSRGAWISLPPALGAVTFFRNAFLLPVLVILVLIPFVLNPEWIPTVIRYRMQDAMAVEQRDEVYAESGTGLSAVRESQSISIRNRANILAGGLRAWGENPFFGHGYGSFEFAMRSATDGGVRGSAHNGWLDMLVTMGGVCVGSLLAVLAYFMYCGWWVYRHETNGYLRGLALGYTGCVPAIIVANMTGQRIDHVDLTAIFWMLSACIVKLRNINLQEMRERGEL